MDLFVAVQVFTTGAMHLTLNAAVARQHVSLALLAVDFKSVPTRALAHQTGEAWALLVGAGEPGG
jgi:hypothetical protein